VNNLDTNYPRNLLSSHYAAKPLPIYRFKGYYSSIRTPLQEKTASKDKKVGRAGGMGEKQAVSEAAP
jgi:hypothetical protein